MATPPAREVDVLRRGLDLFMRRIPSSWSAEVRQEESAGDRRVDAVVDLVASDGARATVLVETKLVVEAKDVAGIAAQTLRLAESLAVDGVLPARLVMARYLSPPVRERLVGAGLGYADATGNLQLGLERPALFIRDAGADRDPWRGPGRPRGNLKGATAARLVRALADFVPPFSVPELAARSGASVGATYRLIEFLEREDLVSRERRSPITRVDWRRIMERWGDDVGVAEAERLTLYLEPRGFPALLTNLRMAGLMTYVLSGSLGARYYDENVPARLGVIYADPVETLVDLLGLRPSPAGNILVGVPLDNGAFERAQPIAGLKVAAPSQVALDLLAGPGRGPSEAAVLLDWMERNPGAWRR